MTFTVVQFKHFVQALITTAQVTNYTVPAASQDVLKNIDLTNTSASAVSVTVNIVPSGGSAGSGNMLFGGIVIPANSTMHWTGTKVMNTGDFISTIAGTTNVVVITCDGLESV
jgi:hypothetical protein